MFGTQFLDIIKSFTYTILEELVITSLLRTGSHDLSRNDEKLSHDQEERKLYYYREDSMYHVFHRLLHMLQRTHRRRYELFWYAHQQMMRR